MTDIRFPYTADPPPLDSLDDLMCATLDAPDITGDGRCLTCHNTGVVVKNRITRPCLCRNGARYRFLGDYTP